MKFEIDWAKTVVCILPTRHYTQSAKVDLDLWPRDQKSKGFLFIIHNLQGKVESDLAKTVVWIVSTSQLKHNGRTHLTNNTQMAASLLKVSIPPTCCEGVSSQQIYMWIMKALSLRVYKLWLGQTSMSRSLSQKASVTIVASFCPEFHPPFLWRSKHHADKKWLFISIIWSLLSFQICPVEV